MPLSIDDLNAIREIVRKELTPMSEKLDKVSDKLDKVLKFVAIEHADFDEKLNGKLKVSRPQEEA